MNEISSEKHYVFYDGDCGFCNFWVQWILKRDLQNQFLFAALQSDFAQNFLKTRNLKLENFDSIYLWKPNLYYLTKSKAIFKIISIVGGKYRWLSYIEVLPKFLTDFIYDIISRNRKKISTQTCEIPSPEDLKKFIL